MTTALHRGCARLREEAPRAGRRRPTASPELVDRFTNRLYARDLLSLVKMALESGAVQAGSPARGGAQAVLGQGRLAVERLPRLPNRPKGLDAWELRHERREHRGESLILAFSSWQGSEGLTTVLRLTEHEGRIACIHAPSDPDFVRALAEELGLPATPFPAYRPPTPGLAKEWPPVETIEEPGGDSHA